MTGIVIATQRERGCVHVVTDAALYTKGVVDSFGSKIYAVAHWPGIIVTVGNGAMSALFGWELSQRFRTFDDMVEGVEAQLPSLVQTFGLPSGADLIIAGVSKERGPEAYACRTDNEPPYGMAIEDAEASAYWADEPFTLTKLGDLTMNPVPSDQVVAARYEGVNLDADGEAVIWGMRKIIEMQRHMALPAGIAIGGFACVTTISHAGIATRMLQEWPEDQVGAPLQPAPINWTTWHRENPKPVATSPDLAPAMSRVRRDIAARKERKGLRLVNNA